MRAVVIRMTKSELSTIEFALRAYEASLHKVYADNRACLAMALGDVAVLRETLTSKRSPLLPKLATRNPSYPRHKT